MAEKIFASALSGPLAYLTTIAVLTGTHSGLEVILSTLNEFMGREINYDHK